MEREGNSIGKAAAQRSGEHAHPDQGKGGVGSKPLPHVLVGGKAKGHVWNDGQKINAHSLIQGSETRFSDADVHSLQHIGRGTLLTNVHSRLQNVDRIRTNHSCHTRNSAGNQVLNRRMRSVHALQT